MSQHQEKISNSKDIVKLYKTHQGWMRSVNHVISLLNVINNQKSTNEYHDPDALKDSKYGDLSVYLKGISAITAMVGGSFLFPNDTFAATKQVQQSLPSSTMVVGSVAASTSNINNSESSYSQSSDSQFVSQSQESLSTKVSNSMQSQLQDSSNQNYQSASLSSNTLKSATPFYNYKTVANEQLSVRQTIANVNDYQSFYNTINNPNITTINVVNNLDLANNMASGAGYSLMDVPHNVTILGNGNSINFGYNFIALDNATKPVTLTVKNAIIKTASELGAFRLNGQGKENLILNQIQMQGGLAISGNSSTGPKNVIIQGNTIFTATSTYTNGMIPIKPMLFSGSSDNALIYGINNLTIAPGSIATIESIRSQPIDYGINLFGAGNHTINVSEQASLRIGDAKTAIQLGSTNNGSSTITVAKNSQLYIGGKNNVIKLPNKTGNVINVNGGQIRADIDNGNETPNNSSTAVINSPSAIININHPFGDKNNIANYDNTNRVTFNADKKGSATGMIFKGNITVNVKNATVSTKYPANSGVRVISNQTIFDNDRIISDGPAKVTTLPNHHEVTPADLYKIDQSIANDGIAYYIGSLPQTITTGTRPSTIDGDVVPGATNFQSKYESISDSFSILDQNVNN